MRIISFGTSQHADIQLTSRASCPQGQHITIANHLSGARVDFTLGLGAAHHATTALIIISTLHELGLDWQAAQSQLAELREVAGRGDTHRLCIAGQHVLLINDSYNAGPASMSAALQDMASKTSTAKTIILTDMLELGDRTDNAHLALVPLILAAEPQLLLCAGPAMASVIEHLPAEITAHHYNTADMLITALEPQLGDSDLILVKGSNGSGAPQIARHLLDRFAASQLQDTPVKGAMHVS